MADEPTTPAILPPTTGDRIALADAYREALTSELRERTLRVDQSMDGAPVITERALAEVIAQVFDLPVPAIRATAAEVRTPGLVTTWAVCPRCGEAQPILVQLTAELLITSTDAELRVKGKSKGRTHVCGQLQFEQGPQASFELEDITAGSDADEVELP